VAVVVASFCGLLAVFLVIVLFASYTPSTGVGQVSAVLVQEGLDTSIVEATAIQYFKARYSEVGTVKISLSPQADGSYLVHGYSDLDLGQFGGTVRRDLICEVKKIGSRWSASDVKSTDPLSEQNLERYLNQP
jgi:hypothetical protein